MLEDMRFYQGGGNRLDVLKNVYGVNFLREILKAIHICSRTE